ncbi:MAG TPA: hypothetical protein VNH83_16680 [Bryobacteraceae bacterium]|nr:hypothetical protein [Bryobacteraceae bacterium]
MKPTRDKEFLRGIGAALAVVHSRGEDTIFDEIVGTVDSSQLVKVARQDGSLRWTGLSAWLKREKTDRGE